MDAVSIFLFLAVGGATANSQPAKNALPSAARDHTAYFAGQAGWDTDRSSPPPAAAPTGDRYQFGAANGTASVSPPPNVVDRTRSAVIETGSALRDGVEADIEAANRQVYQSNEHVIETARNAGQQLGNQFQGWAGTAAQQAGINAPTATSSLPPSTNNRQQVSNPFVSSTSTATTAPAAGKARGGVAPPPWSGLNAASDEPPVTLAARAPATGAPPAATVGRTTVQADGGWTSVHSTVAPPRLAPPRSNISTETDATLAWPITGPSPAGRATTPPPLAGSGGPNFPATITANQPVERSVLADSQARQAPQSSPAATSVDNWDFGWENKAASQPTQQATIQNRYGTAAITMPDASRTPDIAAQQPPANQYAAPVAAAARSSTTQVTQQPGFQPEATFGIGAFDKDGWPAFGSAPPTSPVAEQEATTSGATITSNAVSQPAAGSVAAVGTPPGVAGAPSDQTVTIPQVAPAPALPASSAEERPWGPLLAASLGLAGSIGANLFLGWSYIDARQKYRTLVQKTANKFRRAVAA